MTKEFVIISKKWIFLAGLALAIITPLARAQQLDLDKATRVKAAYILNFAQFVTWPKAESKHPRSTITICVTGDEKLFNALRATVTRKKIKGQEIRIIDLDHINTQLDRKLTSCQVVFIGSTRHIETERILSSIRSLPVLTVSDRPNFARRGGMIGLVLEKGRFVFEISRTTLTNANLQASSKLLNLAKLVDQ